MRRHGPPRAGSPLELREEGEGRPRLRGARVVAFFDLGGDPGFGENLAGGCRHPGRHPAVAQVRREGDPPHGAHRAGPGAHQRLQTRGRRRHRDAQHALTTGHVARTEHLEARAQAHLGQSREHDVLEMEQRRGEVLEEAAANLDVDAASPERDQWQHSQGEKRRGTRGGDVEVVAAGRSLCSGAEREGPRTGGRAREVALDERADSLEDRDVLVPQAGMRPSDARVREGDRPTGERGEHGGLADDAPAPAVQGAVDAHGVATRARADTFPRDPASVRADRLVSPRGDHRGSRPAGREEAKVHRSTPGDLLPLRSGGAGLTMTSMPPAPPRFPAQVRRRDGRLVAFDVGRIERAVARAAREVGGADLGLPAAIGRSVAVQMAKRFGRRPPGVEAIQDAVERALMARGSDDVARAYVLYRARRAELREQKALLGVRDELKCSLAAATVLKERYLRRDVHGRLVESTGEMMDRVATFVAAAEDDYELGAAARVAPLFSALLRDLDFLPNSPTLMNAATPIGLLSGCVVLPMEDSLRAIFATLGQAAVIHQAGGGTGYALSHLRPAGDRVASTGGRASGPLSFLSVFDAAAAVVSGGGRRRGASMAVLDVTHPDILDFIGAKSAASPALSHFNLSVGVSDAFMRAAERGGVHHLVNPRTGRVVGRLPASGLLDAIAEAAHRSGDPGILFLDTINRANPLPGAGRIEATNPCGEVPLFPYESCNLGSVNLPRFAKAGRVDWERLAATVRLAVRFLDDVIDVSHYPFPELERAARATRKVGLGMMGLAELLAVLGIPYDSDAGVRLAARLARLVETNARAASAELAARRGAFPRFAESTLARRGGAPLRNAQLTSVAPTGTISLIAGTTSGIEPMFALAYVRAVLGRRLVETNALFEEVARARGFYSEELMHEVARSGGVRGNPRVPADVRAAFPTALEIAPARHLRMQAAVQRHVDAAVSKTINLPPDATSADVRAILLSAWRAKLKGITVYRSGSRPDEVLSLLGKDAALEAPVRVDTAFSGGCGAHACEY